MCGSLRGTCYTPCRVLRKGGLTGIDVSTNFDKELCAGTRDYNYRRWCPSTPYACNPIRPDQPSFTSPSVPRLTAESQFVGLPGRACWKLLGVGATGCLPWVGNAAF